MLIVVPGLTTNDAPGATVTLPTKLCVPVQVSCPFNTPEVVWFIPAAEVAGTDTRASIVDKIINATKDTLFFLRFILISSPLVGAIVILNIILRNL